MQNLTQTTDKHTAAVQQLNVVFLAAHSNSSELAIAIMCHLYCLSVCDKAALWPSRACYTHATWLCYQWIGHGQVPLSSLVSGKCVHCLCVLHICRHMPWSKT